MGKKTDVAPVLWEHDRILIPSAGYLCGIDEVGRGPLAGGVVAACVILDLSAAPISGINDSKKLNPELRESLYPKILANAVAYGVGEASPKEIDQINILNATFLAMRRALESMAIQPVLLLVDGNQKIPSMNLSQRTLVGGDGLSASIAAASIVAKVTRDRSMEEWGNQFPEYGFARHKGYGTADHCRALTEHGLSSIHRRSFCSSFVSHTSPLH